MHTQLAILHAQNTYNNGSFMMLINFLWYYVKHAPENTRITFWIELDGTDNYDRLRKALPDQLLGSEKVDLRQLPVKITSVDQSSFLRKVIRLFAKFYSHPRYFKKLGINTVIILGGDDISEYYKKWMILSDLYRIYRYSKFFNTILGGQTIGPFNGLREKVAAKCLSKAVMFSRDDLTATYLKDQLNIPANRIYKSADLCFPELPLPHNEAGIGPDNEHGILLSYGLDPDGYITLVPGGFYSLYTKDKQGYIDSWRQLVNDLLEVSVYKRMKIVLLPHVTRPEDDREMIDYIYDSLIKKGGHSDRICVIKEELLPYQLRQILGHGYFTISSRMHAALSTFQMKKPAVAIGYSIKYDGVIGQSLQCPELVVHCSADLLANPGRFSREVLAKTSFVEEHYQQLLTHLELRVPDLAAMAEEQIREIVRVGKDWQTI